MSEVPFKPGQPSINLTLSGGGHRAALFGLGVLLYLADTERNGDVTSISSVSGGSITNGCFAQAPHPYNQADRDKIWEVGRDLARTIATKGSLMGREFSTPVLASAGALLVAAWIALAIDPIWVGAGLSSLIGILAGVVLATTFRGVLARLYVVILTLTLVWVTGGPWLLPLPAALRFLILLMLVAFWIALIAGKRSAVCERAYQDTFFSPGDEPTKLGNIHEELDHIFCATELQSSEALYFSKKFVAGYRYGIGDPGQMTLARAVQASACLPFALPRDGLRTSRSASSFLRTMSHRSSSVPKTPRI